MTEVFRLADLYVEELCALDPFSATALGIPGHDDEVTDYSPDGVEARVDLDRRTLRALGGHADRERRRSHRRGSDARSADVGARGYEVGAPWRQLSAFDCPISFIRMAFDLCPRDTSDDWEQIATRMLRVPESARRLHEIAPARPCERSPIAARRQALVCADQAATLGGLDERRGRRTSRALAAEQPQPAALAASLQQGRRPPPSAYAGMSRFLREEYAPQAREADAVGPRALRTRGSAVARHEPRSPRRSTPGAGTSCTASRRRWP